MFAVKTALNARVSDFVDQNFVHFVSDLARFPLLKKVEGVDVFLGNAMFAMTSCLLTCMASTILSPRLFERFFENMSRIDRKVWHTNMATYFPAFFVTLYALPAVVEFYESGDNGREFVREASIDTVRACGLSLGYMVWDLGVMLQDPKGQQVTYGGKKAYYLFVVHHVFSILIWPYAVLWGRCVFFVNFFLVSEVTNVNMSTRWFLLKCKMEKSSVYLVNGLAWIPLFLGVRVLVIPLMLNAFIFGTWGKLNLVEKIVAFVFLPIPSMLNVYWSKMIVSNAMKYLITGEDPENLSQKEKENSSNKKKKIIKKKKEN